MIFWEFDCSLASFNILLATEVLRLGAVWTAAHPDLRRIDFVRKQLQLPTHIVPFNLITIDYPTGKYRPKDRYKKEWIHSNKF